MSPSPHLRSGFNLNVARDIPYLRALSPAPKRGLPSQAPAGDRSSTPLFANKLLIRTAEGTIRLRAGISRRQETGGTRVLTIHCLSVTINPTRERRCIYGWRSLWHRRNSLTGLSEQFRCGHHRARQHHHQAKHTADHRTSPSLRAKIDQAIKKSSPSILPHLVD